MSEKSQYKSLAEWRKANPKDYGVAKYNKWLDDIADRFGWSRNNFRWTKELCVKEVKKYDSIQEWRNHGTGYSTAHKNGWLDECCEHMLTLKKKWTEELCIQDGRKYDSIQEWRDNNYKSYDAAKRNGWLNVCKSHMKNHNGRIWTKERCIEEAKKYGTKTEWAKNSGSSYNSARTNGWFDECTAHMK